MHYNILIIDDDLTILNLMTDIFGTQYHVTAATSAKELKQLLASEQTFDVLLLDIMLPDGDGIELCQQIEKSHPQLMIILITANQSDINRILGIELGADDYIQKPFDVHELKARIKALLRRKEKLAQPENTSIGNKKFPSYHFNGWTLNTRNTMLTAPDGSTVPLTHSSYRLLLLFLQNPQTTLSRDVLIETLYQEEATYSRNIDKHISRLRHQLREDNDNPMMIKTIRSKGYIFSAPVGVKD